MNVYLYLSKTLGDELIERGKIEKIFGEPIGEYQDTPVIFSAGSLEYKFWYCYTNTDISTREWQDVWAQLDTAVIKLCKKGVDPKLLAVCVVYDLIPIKLSPQLIIFDGHGNINSREADKVSIGGTERILSNKEENHGTDET